MALKVKSFIIIEARPSEGDDFVTVKDYVGGEFVTSSPCRSL
jgi:hypothetical protein